MKFPDKIMTDVSSSVNPDGDVDVTWNYDDFRYPDCPKCHGIMKPSVVFFGENIQESLRQRTFDAVDNSECMVAIGTSLTVYSAYRLVKRCHEQNKPVVILNIGQTRADQLAHLKYDEPILNRLRDLVPKK
jgi:NAD-dependent deacetylase sirtuin 4